MRILYNRPNLIHNVIHTVHIIPFPIPKVTAAKKPNAFKHSHFAPAFYFLAPPRREALKLLYSVFRIIDDAVDLGANEAEAFLTAWRRVFEFGDSAGLAPFGQENLGKAFVKELAAFDLPREALLDFIDKGVSVDLKRNRFRTFSDTEDYCYGVAGTVGLACLPIFGVPWLEAREFAVRLGIAVQWINTIRDVGADAQLGRIYLPLDHLELFGYTERDLLLGRNTVDFQRLITYETDIARTHYQRAMDLLPPRWERELLPAKIMGRIYLNLLNKLERRQFPVISRQISLNLIEKGLATWQAVRE